MKKMLTVSLTIALTFAISTIAAAKVTNHVKTSVPSTVLEENNPSFTLQYKIYIENFKGGVISKVVDGVHTVMGNVVTPATSTYEASDGYWAAHYVRALDGTYGAVTGMGVNAMHLFVGPEQAYDPSVAQLGPANVWKPRLISLLPSGEPGGSGRIGTNIAGGSEIFGGWSAAFVGSPVKYYTSSQQWKPIEEYYRTNGYNTAPTRILIEVYKPTTSHGEVSHIIFENEVGGDVILKYANGYTKTIATVLQRVNGHGRFAGSEYAGLGSIRANHGGVLCLSTSNKTGDPNLRGGFQIIPANHAKYLKYFLNSSYIDAPQWMVVGPLGSDPTNLSDPTYFNTALSYDPAWEAIAPIFGMYIKPKYIPGNKAASTYFEVSKDGGLTWQDPDLLQGNVSNTSLMDVTHVRIKLNY